MKCPHLLLLFFLLVPWSPAIAQESESVNLRESYTLRPNDLVALSVYEEPDLSTSVTIQRTGRASFPLIGSVQIGGLGLEKAASQIKDLYAAKYIRNPQVTLTVTAYATDFVHVIGQVKQPGPVPIPPLGNLDLGAALATAGGITETADPENIQLITADGASRVLTLVGIQGEAGRFVLKSGDRLIVNESPFARAAVTVIGEVKKPGPVAIPPSGNLDLASALATAGGLGPEADTSRIKVISTSGKTSSYAYQAIQSGTAGRMALGRGDRVVVPKSPFVNTTVTILGQVKNPGAIALPIDGRLDLMTAIAMAGGFTDLANKKKVSVIRLGRKTILDINKLSELPGPIMLAPNDIVSVGERFF